ncbi:hypothetical protein CDAR_31431 [Caerostris darwini]|uniref:Uncharacterized protein n=1 Tax=Caerostris darwini TaxID=1538125 RepID=A0AAV4SVW5_9ARAC|nr:hypothetical protein CDAR_31431 [Caerostris darwini]
MGNVSRLSSLKSVKKKESTESTNRNAKLVIIKIEKNLDYGKMGKNAKDLNAAFEFGKLEDEKSVKKGERTSQKTLVCMGFISSQTHHIKRSEF